MPARAPSPRMRLAVACAGAVSILLGLQALTPALPAMQQALGLSDSEVGLFTAVYLLPGALLAFPLGVLADALGRRRVFGYLLILFSVTGLGLLVVDHYGAMLALRFVQGVGVAGVLPVTITLIGDTFTGRDQVRAQSFRVFAMTSGEFALPMIGGALALLSWRAPMTLQALALPVALLGLYTFDDATTRLHRREYASGLAGALRQAGMASLLVAGLARFLFRFVIITYVPILMVSELGASVAVAGIVVSVAAGAAAIAGLQTARLLRHIRPSLLMAMAMSGLGVGLLGFALASNWQQAAAAAVVFGMMDGILAVLQSGYLTRAVAGSVRAGMVGISGTLRNFGKFLAPSIISVLVLFGSVSTAFMLVAALALLMAPAMRPVRHLDAALLAEDQRPVPGGEGTAVVDEGSRPPPAHRRRPGDPQPPGEGTGA